MQRMIPLPVTGAQSQNARFDAGRRNRPAFPRVELVSGTKELDVTFSLGRATDETEVMGILIASGCVEAENYID